MGVAPAAHGVTPVANTHHQEKSAGKHCERDEGIE
jgi:hypothetical protein